MNKTLKYLILTCFLVVNYDVYAQSRISTPSHKSNAFTFVKDKDLFGTRAFVENKGQFADIDGQTILFAFENGSERIYFTNKGLIHKFVKYFPLTEEQHERLEKGRHINVKQPEPHYVFMNWVNTNQNLKIEKLEKQEHYLTYGEARYNSYPYKKIIYKNVYDNIDIEYGIPEDKELGIKYNVILNPGAKLEDIKMAYSGDFSKIKFKKNGDILIKTPLEDITEHAPKSFYLNNDPIASGFLLKDNVISFNLLGNYDSKKTIVIDPWLTTLTTIGTNNSAYDVDYDDFGNLFVYGGLSGSCNVAKFNTSGSLLWTFSGVVTLIGWNSFGISNFVVMKSLGKCYVGQGYNASTGAIIIRLDINGNYDNFASPAQSSWNEVWDMAYHCSTGNVYGMGGSTSSSQSAGILNPLTGTISPISFFTYPTTNIDVVSHAIDDAGEFFWVYASGATAAMNNKIARINSAFTSSVWIAPSGFGSLAEFSNKGAYNPSPGSSNGFNCLAVNGNYLYYYDGFNLAAYNKSNGSQVGATTVSSQTIKKQGGIAVDDCDNLYIGGNGSVLCYNFNGSSFTALPGIPLTTTVTNQYVYDIRMSKLNKLLYVSGSGFAGVYVSLNSLSCCTSSLVCAFSPPALTANNTSITCASLGSATINPLGGPGPYSYTWIPSGQTGTVASGLAPGTHSVVVFDAGCNQTFTATTLLVPLVPLTGSVVSVIPCYGQTSGSATVTNLSGGSVSQNYLWGNGTSTQTSVIASGLGSGTWSVTVTDAVTFCIFSQTFQLVPPPQQSLTLSQSATSVCAGSNVSLLSNTGGGTPAYTYSWTGGGTAANYQTTQLAAGTFVYSLTVSDAYNCAITKTIAVNFISTPTLSISNTSICPQQVGTLTVSGAVTYTWANNTNGNTFTANPLTTTLYTVTGSGAICSSTAAASIVLKSIPSPTLTSNSPVCLGQPLYLNGSGGASYLWNGPPNFISNLQNPIINPILASNFGVYTATVTGANSCTASASQTVVVNSLPPISASGSTVCVTQTVNLNGTSSFPGCTFFWSGPNSFTSNLQSISILNPSVNLSGNYSLAVTDANGCVSNAVANVTVSAMPVPSFTSNSALCAGKTLSLNATATTGGVSYSWLGPNGFSSNLQNPPLINVPVLANGVYTLFVTTGPCITSTVHPVVVYPLPTLAIVGLPNICDTKTLALSIQASGNVISYSWFGPLSFTSSSASILRAPATPNFSGIYTAVVSDTNSCSSSATVAVNILANPVMAVSDVTVCLHESAILNASGAVSYFWTGPGFFQSTNQNAFISAANSSTQVFYMVTGTAANSCTSTAIVGLSTLPLPLPSLSVLPGSVLCLNDHVNFTGYGGKSYQWRGPDGIYFEGKTLSFIMFGIFKGGTYTLTAIDSAGCKASVDTLLIVNQLPTGSLQKINPQSCIPFCSDFYFTSSPSVKASWQITNDLRSGKTFSYCFTTAGTFTITGLLYDSTTTCRNSIDFYVVSYPKPKADFTFTPDKPVENTDVVIFTNTSQGEEINRFNWFFINDKGYTSTSKNTSYLFDTEGQYPVVLIVKNKWDCSDSIVKSIQIEEDFSIYVPNTFTPNQDGLNEIFLPIIRAGRLYHLSVFDRWGALLFETSSITTGWDGTYKGQACKSDVYVWTITISTNNGESKKMKGHISLYK